MDDHSGSLPRHFVVGAVDVGSGEGPIAVGVDLVDPCSVVPDLTVLLARSAVQRWG